MVQNIQTKLSSCSNVSFIALTAAVSPEHGSSAVAAGPSTSVSAQAVEANPQAGQVATVPPYDTRQSLVLLSSTDGDPSLALTAATVPDELRSKPQGGLGAQQVHGNASSMPGAGSRGLKRQRDATDIQDERRDATLRLWRPLQSEQTHLAAANSGAVRAIVPHSASHARAHRALAAILGRSQPQGSTGYARTTGQGSKAAFRSPALALTGSAQQQALQHGHRYHFQKSSSSKDPSKTANQGTACFPSWSLADVIMQSAVPLAPSAHPTAGTAATGVQLWIKLSEVTVFDQLKRVKSDSSLVSLLSSTAVGRFLTVLRINSGAASGATVADQSATESACSFPDTLPADAQVVCTVVLCSVLSTHRAGRVLLVRAHSGDANALSEGNAVAISQAPDLPTTCCSVAVDTVPPKGSSAAKHHHVGLGAAGVGVYTSELGHMQV